MARNARSPRQLIEERVNQMARKGGELAFEDAQKVYFYSCLDTGMPFKTFGEAAQRSPFTGSSRIVEQTAADFQSLDDIPGNQKDPMKQTPVSANPVPAAPGAGPDSDAPWFNQPWDDNPAPDMTGQVGADAASLGSRGYVPYPQRSIPPHVNKNPSDRTDDAPAGSK